MLNYNGVYAKTVPAEVICIERFLENGTFIHDCELFVNTLIQANNFTLIYLNYNPTVNIAINETQGGY